MPCPATELSPFCCGIAQRGIAIRCQSLFEKGESLLVAFIGEAVERAYSCYEGAVALDCGGKDRDPH